MKNNLLNKITLFAICSFLLLLPYRLKSTILLFLIVNASLLNAQETNDTTSINVKNTGHLKSYGYEHVDHNIRKPGAEIPHWSIKSPSDIHVKIQKILVNSISDEKLKKLTGKRLTFSFNIKVNGKVKSVRILLPIEHHVDFNKKECQQIISGIKKDVTFETDKKIKNVEDMYILLGHKIE